MAEAKRAFTGDDFLLCTLCNHVYKDPKQLPCLHSFCCDCLKDYVLMPSSENNLNENHQVKSKMPISRKCQPTQQTKDGDGQHHETDKPPMTYCCPVCNTPISIDPELTLLEFIQELPSNNALLMMIQEEQFNKPHPYCDLCIKSDDKIRTKVWCFDCQIALCNMCEHYHNRFPTLENHRVIPLDESEATGHAPVVGLDILCEDHDGSRVEFFCFDHHYPCCNHCLESNHNKCQNITPISVAAKNADGSDMISDLSTDADALILRYQKLKQDKIENIANLTAQHATVESEITQFGTSVTEHFNSLIHNMMLQNSTLHTQTISDLEQQIKDMDNAMKQATNCKAIIHACSKIQSSVKVMQQLDKINTFFNKQVELLKEYKKKEPIVEYKIKYNIPIEEIKTGYQNLGSVKVVKKKRVSDIPTKKRFKKIQDIPLIPVADDLDDADSKQKSRTKRGCKFAHKKGRIFVKGIAIHPSGSIKLINNFNGNLYIYDAEGVFLKCMDLGVHGESFFKPFDLAILDDTSIAISVPQKCEIFKLNLGNMSKKEWLQTQDKCYGLYVAERKLFTSCTRCIEIFDIDSESSTTIPKLRYSNGYLCVAPDLERIYYTAESHLVCVAMDGTELYRNSEHACLSGITQGVDGCIYVTDDETKTLGRYTQTLEKVQKFPLPFIPSALDVLDTSGRFYVCHQQKSEGNKNVRDNDAVSIVELS